MVLVVSMTPVMHIDPTGEFGLLAALLVAGVIILTMSLTGCNKKSEYEKETEKWDDFFGENTPNVFSSVENLMFELDRQAYYEAKKYYSGEMVFNGSMFALELMSLPTNVEEIKMYSIDKFTNEIFSNKSFSNQIGDFDFAYEIAQIYKGSTFLESNLLITTKSNNNRAYLAYYYLRYEYWIKYLGELR